MPPVLTKNKSLSQLYVFYNRLQEDGYTELYGYVRESLKTQGTKLQDIITQTERIRAIAQAENNKEIKLLNTIFNANVTVDWDNTDSIKQFIDTLNACLGLKSVYERNIHLIKNSQGSKSVISFFHTYFGHAWDDQWPAVADKIVNQIEDKPQSVMIKIASEEIDTAMDSIVKDAIKRMFNAEPELTSMDEGMQDAYLQLVDAIGSIQNKGSLANQLYNIYKLGDLKQLLAQEIRQRSKNFVGQSVRNFNPKGEVATLIHQRGGLSLEAIENTVLNIIVSSVSKASDAKVQGVVRATGSLGTKADNVVAFGIDSTTIDEILRNNEKVSRARNIKMFNELGEKLKNIEDGYVVYSSDKNYTYNSDFKSRGGFSGEHISIKTYKEIMSSVNNNIDTFVGTILQTAPGAVGDKGIKTTAERAIAQDVAFLLFDDFSTIGNTGNGNAIHVMNLNGVLIPLSFFLTILADAIEYATYNPTTIVKATVDSPSILFPSKESQSEWQSQNKEKSAWSYQREVALDQTTISINFLGNFKAIIQQFL